MINDILKSEIELLIYAKREDDYWDYKERHHGNTADLLHDIICMANNRADRDAYIIYGVTDRTGEVMGVENDNNRRNQQKIIDQLKEKKFAGGIRPRIELRTLGIKGHEVDILIVKNTTDTPYYLTEDYRDKNRIVRANHIYTRVCDTNTDINKSADINHVEYLWRKRFLLNKTPLEQIISRLKNKEEWIREEDTYYNTYNPEFTISIEEDDDLSPKFYSYAMANESTYYQVLEIKYFGTKLYSQQIVLLDSGRYMTNTPNWGFLYFCEHGTADFSYNYFIKNDNTYKIHRFLLNESNHEAVYANQRFCEVVLIFENLTEKEQFTEFVHNNRGKFLEDMKAMDGEYSWVEINNKRLQNKIVTQLKTGKILNKMLHEWRSLPN